MNLTLALASFAVFILSVIVHEISHGLAALSQGDGTAKYQGRLTLNPLKHIDPVGSIFVPLLCLLSGSGFMFGWAKPVPYNPYNLRNGRWSELWVAIAGPLSNIIIALVFGLFLRFYVNSLPDATLNILAVLVEVNIVLAVFNMVPLPPLDGSKVLLNILPFRMAAKIRPYFERYGLVLTLVFILFLWQYSTPLIVGLFGAITGISL